MHEDIVPRSSFYEHFFPHFYPNEPTSQPVNNHRLAVLYMILSLGSLFDLNVPARESFSTSLRRVQSDRLPTDFVYLAASLSFRKQDESKVLLSRSSFAGME